MAKKKKNYYEFITPLNIEECMEKISKPVKYGPFYGLKGKVKNTSFRFRYYPGYQNAFIRPFYGELIAQENRQTLIRGELRFPIFQKLFQRGILRTMGSIIKDLA